MLQSVILKYCAVPVSLVLSMIKIESGFNPNAIKDGNFGLMQVRTATASSHCGIKTVDELMKLENNIRCGCSYLSFQYRRYGNNFSRAILAYNQGHVKPSQFEKAKYNRYVKGVINEFHKVCKQNGDCEQL